MSDLFEEEEDLIEGDSEELPDIEKSENNILDARRRLENMLEEKRLRDELDDFVDD